MRHYEATGRKYPLVVKLGTITPHGADVYSYAAEEDDMVTDPLLAQHLEHWGINMMRVRPGDTCKPVQTRCRLLYAADEGDMGRTLARTAPGALQR